MVKNYIAYIDEAGDEGFGKLASSRNGGQSRWLVLGACILGDGNDRLLPQWRDEIHARLGWKNNRTLHFRDLAHDQRIVVCQEIAARRLGISVVFSHKATIPNSPIAEAFKTKGYLYNYMVRWLLERVVDACKRAARDEPAILRIVFSQRGGTNYAEMRKYLTLLRDQQAVISSPRVVDWTILDIENIRVEAHNKWAGLQMADCATSAFFRAVEPNHFGNYEVSYARLLRPRLIQLAGCALGTGVTVVPSLRNAGLDADQQAFFRSFKK